MRSSSGFFLFLFFFLTTEVRSEGTFLDYYRMHFSPGSVTVSAPDAHQAMRKWSPGHTTVPEYYDFPAPGSKRLIKDQTYLRRAANHYAKLHELIRDVGKMKLQYSRPDGSLREELWWKKLDQMEGLARIRRKKTVELYGRITGLSREVLKDLNRIATPTIRQSDVFLQMEADAQRKLILYEINQGNYLQALGPIEDYKKKEEHLMEWPLHYYHAVVLDFIYRSAKKNPAISYEQRQELFKEYARVLLRAVELKHGSESYEFQFMKDQIEQRWVKEEILSQVSNSVFHTCVS